MREVVIAIDIGGTFTKFGIVDKQGNCLKDNFISTDKYPNIDNYLHKLQAEIESTIYSVKEPVKVLGMGIGAPNGNYLRGTIEEAPNLNWKGIIPLVEKLKILFPNILIVLTNDANAAAIGEMVYGGAKGMKNFIVITLGTGLGSGIVSDGKLVYGHDGFAGEIGHTNVEQNGRECGCGNKGCLETYASATGIRRTVFKLIAERLYDGSLKKVSFEDLSSEMISEAAKKGDSIALEAFEITGKILGVKLADAVACTSPKTIFLLGGLAKAGDLLLKPTRKYLDENLFPTYRGKIQLCLSGLTETSSAIVGAAALAWKELQE